MSTRALILFAVLLGAGCGDDAVCGPDQAPADGIAATAGADQVAFQAFNSSPNNDCTPNQGDPTSLTLDGTQVGEPGFHITFCLPRPHRIGSAAIDITDTDLVQVIDINARLDASCLLSIDRSRDASGSIRFAGYCDDGLAADGYAIELAATVPGTVTCGADQTSVDIALSGTAAVEAL